MAFYSLYRYCKGTEIDFKAESVYLKRKHEYCKEYDKI